MKRYLSIILLTAGLVLSVQSVSAQKLKNVPKRNDAYRPEMVTKPSFSIAMSQTFASKKYGQGSESGNYAKDYWDVYSDRDNNQTYAAPKAKDPYATLSFREKVRIAAIRGNFALVYAIPDGPIRYPALPANIQWKGWVPMENLILWDHALCQDDGHEIKYLLSNTLQLSKSSDNIGKLFSHPTEPRNFVTLPSSSKSIFYLLKQENRMLLLALERQIGDNPETIYGWVDLGSILCWPSRLCLEPTWEVQDVESFAEAGVSSEFFPDMGLDPSAKLGSIPFQKLEMPSYREEFYRTMGNQWRFPLLDNRNANFGVCAVPVNSPYFDRNKNSDSIDEDELGADLNQINIVFVLDGSRAYEQYYPLITDNFKQLRSALVDYTTRVGIQFYRDIRNEDFSTEYTNMVDTRNRDLESFLTSGGTYGYRENFSDPALLKGISDALDKADFQPSETNVLIVVGGKGDASDSGAPLPKRLADRLDATNVSLYAIQLQNNPSSSMYELFNYQMEDMLYSKLNARVRKTGTDLDAVIQTDKQADGMVGHVTYALNDASSTYPENLLYPVEGMLDESVFVEHLNGIYSDIARDIKRKKQELSSGDAGLSQIFARVVATSADRANRQLFKKVAAFDEDELNAMMTAFAPFYEMAQTSSVVPSVLYAELLKLLDRIPENVEIKPDDRGCYEVLRLFEGIPVDNTFYKGWKLKEIREGKVFTHEVSKMFLDQFAFKYRKLLEIVRNPYPNTTRINGKMYYWIPVDYLP